MSDITRDDLRKRYKKHEHGGLLHEHTRKVTDEEFDRLAREAGYVKAPQLSKGPSEMLGKLWVERNLAKASRALFTDQCGNCNGSGDEVRKCESKHCNGTHGLDFFDCRECGGRGWLPKDEVFIEWHCDAPSYAKEYGGCNPGDDFYPHRHTLCRWQVEFPADWLEAEDEQ